MPTQALPAEADERWGAVLARDPAADGHFVYAGAHDRGVLPAELRRAGRPARENVSFHACGETARRAGFRPCSLRPDEPPAASGGRRRSPEPAG